MNPVRSTTIFRNILLFVYFVTLSALAIQKREWVDTTAALSEGDVFCFSEYMEIAFDTPSAEGLGVWLSGALKIPYKLFNMDSLEQLNLKMSDCGFTLYKDADSNLIFRVNYRGCSVHLQDGNYLLTLNLTVRISQFRRRSRTLVMKCPAVSIPTREHIQCDHEYIQVTRQVPYDNWNNELPWLLSLSNRIIVALEDASLIQVNIDMNSANITVQGRRSEVLSPVRVLEDDCEFLALRLVSGQHAYSMEATCPKEPRGEEMVLHIYKRRMGLTRRGSPVPEALTVSNVSVKQTENFTFHETNQFATITIPTTEILQIKSCPDNKQIWQLLYRADVVLTFRETNHTMHWSMENALACTAEPSKHSFKGNLPNKTMQHK